MNATAIIINYHTSRFLPPLVGDLQETELIEKIIIIDNSNELHGKLWNGAYPQKVKTIVNEKNIGFAAAVNQACRYVETDWFLLVNPDVRIDEKSIFEMLKAARRYDSPILGPRFFWDDQKRFRLPPATGSCLWLDFAGRSAEGFVLDSELFSFYWILRHNRFWQAEDPFCEPFLSGACLLINKEWAHRSVFDERFFLYFEDTDLCAKAVQKGLYPLCIPSASAIHYYDQSPDPKTMGKGKRKMMEESGFLFHQKYYGGIPVPNLSIPSSSKPLQNLGKLTLPPILSSSSSLHGELFYEISVNRHFVPFAQSIMREKRFRIPMDVWKRLKNGIYYSRIRSSLKTEVVCQWEKAA